MSYSYVKSVFPNFNSSVYDSKLYETTQNTPNIKEFSGMESQAQKSYSIIDESEKDINIEEFTDNLKFYNLPLNVNNNTPNITNITNTPNTLNTPTTLDSHLSYTNHILECPSCKELLLKQLSIDSDKIKNEEIMELISFIIFGIFILLLLDNFKR